MVSVCATNSILYHQWKVDYEHPVFTVSERNVKRVLHAILLQIKNEKRNGTWTSTFHFPWQWTSLRCHWQTRATPCFMPTVLYTDVNDSNCDKLVINDGHQFTTLTVHLSWQHLRRSDRSRDMVGAHWYLNGSLELTSPLQEWFAICGLAIATINQSTKFEVYLH